MKIGGDAVRGALDFHVVLSGKAQQPIGSKQHMAFIHVQIAPGAIFNWSGSAQQTLVQAGRGEKRIHPEVRRGITTIVNIRFGFIATPLGASCYFAGLRVP